MGVGAARRSGVQLIAFAAASILAVVGIAPLAYGTSDYAELNTSTQMVSTAENVQVTALDPHLRAQTINRGWKFILGEQSGAANPQFDDSAWRNVDLPHDYSIEQPFTSAGEAESGYLLGGIGWYRKTLALPAELSGKRVNLNFDGIYMDATIYVNGQELANHPYGYTPFSVDVTDAVKFGQDNVIAVRVNHQTPSSRWYSGSGIYRDVDLVITDPVHLALDGVKVTAPAIDSYTGSGKLQLDLSATLENEGNAAKTVTVKQTLKAKDSGAVLGTVSAEKTLAAGAKETTSMQLEADSPQLWSLENPELYVLTTEIFADEQLLDAVDTVTGFRQLKFDSNTGFELNGKKLKLKGVSMHHDQGALGAKAYRRAIERQMELLKEMGANTIRITHNPASRDLIELANEHGMLLIEEIFDGWQYPKNSNNMDYARFFEKTVPTETHLENVADGSTWARYDLESTLRRDYNAPSVIMWSLGNEIGEGTGNHTNLQDYSTQQARLIEWAQAVDQTRPVTRGDNTIKKKPATSIALMDQLVQAGGTAGLNYVDQYVNVYDEIHQQYPDWPIYASETASAVNSRGVYTRASDNGRTADKRLTSYDASYVGWGAEASRAWYNTVTRDFVAGEMVWTGFDYIGEPTHWNGITAGAIGDWPAPKNSYFGIIDTAGFPKDSYYFYQSQWNEAAHTLHILPAWNEDVVAKSGADNTVPVVVYTDAQKVALYFTPTGGERQLIGTKEFAEKTTDAGYKYQIYEGSGKAANEHQNLYLTWQVPYQDGKLEAIGYDSEGKQIEQAFGRNEVQTAGAAKKLEVKVDRSEINADNEDLAYVDVTITDENGVPVPNAENVIAFSANGQCSVVGTDNGEQADHTSYLSTKRKAFSGKVLGIVKAANIAGDCEVTVSGEGFDPQKVQLSVEPVEEVNPEVVDHYRFPRNYYVQLGTEPKFPAEIDAVMQDGTVRNAQVKWDQVSAEQQNTAGNFTVSGTTSFGDVISVNVAMLNTAAAVLNYSGVTTVGKPYTLPTARPAVLPDGKVLATNFPVKWEEPAADAYRQPGIVTISGTATVFGAQMPVTATIRVVAQKTEIGANRAGAAAMLTQDIPQEQQSDTLSAIKDGESAVPAIQSGVNPSVWTNYAASQAGDTQAEIVFGYDTQQSFGEFTVYFYRDNWSARYPEAGSTKFYFSDSADGPWEEVQTVETIGAEETNVTPYTYQLAEPVMATYLKIVVTNPNVDLGNRKPCIGISEVLLKGANIADVSAHSTAKLAALTVNGKELAQSVLDSWQYLTPETKLNPPLEASTLDNAALTVLPEHDGIIRLIVESEDHQQRQTFQIFLGRMADDDQSLDVKAADTRIEVGSQHATSGNNSKDSALDGQPDTMWHTPWGSANPIAGDAAKLAENGWAVLILDEATEIQALRYLPRSDGNNGTITGYEVYVSNTDAPAGPTTADGVQLPSADQYTKVASGTWADNHEWKVAQFDQVYTAKYVQLVPTATVSDQGANMFVSAAELRVRAAAEGSLEQNSSELTEETLGGEDSGGHNKGDTGDDDTGNTEGSSNSDLGNAGDLGTGGQQSGTSSVQPNNPAPEQSAAADDVTLEQLLRTGAHVLTILGIALVLGVAGVVGVIIAHRRRGDDAE